jgi:membrane-associated phospholipid phosphatase
MVDMIPILEWGIPVIQWMQSLGSWLEPVMQFFTFLGTENFYLLILPIFLWWIDIGLGIQIGLGLLFSGIINSILKILFGLPRPFWVSNEISAFSSESSFGLPSGHAQNAVVIWGLLAAWSKKGWFRAVMAVLILMIAISRIYLGVHFPTDTLVGLLVGGLILWAFLRFYVPIKKWIRQFKLSRQLLFALFVSLLMLGIGLGSIYLTRDRVIPNAWVEQAEAAIGTSAPIDPVSSDGIIANVATFFGISSGALILLDWGKFTPEGSWGLRIGRYLIGIIGLILLYFGLRAIFPTDPHLLGAIFRFLRYSLVGFWVAFLAPYVFVKLRLA